MKTGTGRVLGARLNVGEMEARSELTRWQTARGSPLFSVERDAGQLKERKRIAQRDYGIRARV